jgi:hypothetical protein
LKLCKRIFELRKENIEPCKGIYELRKENIEYCEGIYDLRMEDIEPSKGIFELRKEKNKNVLHVVGGSIQTRVIQKIVHCTHFRHVRSFMNPVPSAKRYINTNNDFATKCHDIDI